jgi:ABC-type polysaccharide/polyol phosphate transport system ATPase subunit
MTVDSVSISVRGLSKTFRLYRRPHHRLLQWVAQRAGSDKKYCLEVDAVHDISFDVGVGETVVILGRNGSGKSTLLQMIAGTLTPTNGTTEVKGRVSALLELGAGFNPDYTGRENLRLNARIFGLSTPEIDAAEPGIERFADIGAFIDEPVRTYSSGMYVRLAFATAIHLIPDVLIVDEALAVGDVFFQQKCIDYILTRMQHATKLIVTHDVATAARLGDRVLVIDSGHLIFDGPPLKGIEQFTSLNLRERAYGTSHADDSNEDVVEVLGLAEEETSEQVLALDPEKSSNPELLQFENVMMQVASNGSGDGRWVIKPTMVAGDRLTVVTDISVSTSVKDPVVGYLIRDRVGNVIFGQNTVGSSLGLPSLSPGRYRVAISFVWPEVAEGEYLMTLGAGDGKHPLHHSILGWAQNIASVVSAPERPVHGMFNSDILSAEVKRLT